jgi:alkanesulfonate monooxygenase SsuD/methylene tetrahydromethanopterin reductase-like flavin-dependent oxidoreductase (luciferase family)
MTSDYEESGIPHDPAGVRVARMLEGLAVMKGLWEAERFSFSGEHYTITEAQGLPRPASTPHPPIVIGGGSKRILTIAGQEADIVGINPDLRSGRVGPEVIASVVPEKWDERVGWVKDAAGSRFGELEIQVLTFLVMVGKPKEEAIASAAPLFGVPAEVAAEIPIAMAGTVEEICDDLEARRERWGFNYIVIHEGELEAFAPVVERLSGK